MNVTSLGGPSSALSAPRSTGGGHGRRRARRAPYVREAVIEVIGYTRVGESMNVHTRDVSELGLSFLTPVSFRVGAAASIVVASPRGKRVAVCGFILRCRPISDGWHKAAVEFFTPEPSLAAAEVELRQSTG